MAKKKWNKERAKAILWRVLWIVGLILLVGISGAVIGGAVGGPVGAVVGGLMGAAAGAAIGVSIAMQVQVPPKDEDLQEVKASPSIETIPEPKPEAPMSMAAKVQHDRYVCNSHTHEIHDTENLKAACMFEAITEEHKVKLNSLQEVEEAIEKQGYNGCRWCMSQYDTG